MSEQYSEVDQAARDQLIPLAEEYQALRLRFIEERTMTGPLSPDFSNVLSREETDWEAVEPDVRAHFGNEYRYNRAKAAFDYVVQFREGTWAK